MFKWIRIIACIIFLIAGIFFAGSAVVNMQPGVDTIANPYDKTSVRDSDVLNPNKGSYVIAYSILGGMCLLGAAMLLGSLKGNKMSD